MVAPSLGRKRLAQIRARRRGRGEAESVATRQPDRTNSCSGTPVILDAFGFDSATLTAAHRIRIAELARQIARSQTEPNPVHTVCLRGHTDTSGNETYNTQLGMRRATAVKTELVAALTRERRPPGVRLQFEVGSDGERRPIAPETTADGRARNRRVEVFLNNRWRGGGPTPSGRGITVVPTPSAREEEGYEEEDFSLTENDPPEFVVLVGTGKGFTATAASLPLGVPGYTWATSDAAVATVGLVSGDTIQTHPNRVTVRGVAPGRARITVTCRDSGGRTSSTSIRIVVARVTFPSFADPAGVPVALPAVNPMTRPVTMATRRTDSARRTVVARFEPIDFFVRKNAQWTLTPVAGNRGALPAAHATSFEAVAGRNFTAATNRSEIDASGQVTVRVNLPLVAFNKARLAVTSVEHSVAKGEIDLEVPGIVVVDPGHGGNPGDSLPGSSWNNATSFSGVLENTMTLDFGRRVRDALQGRADHLITVHMTRNANVNVSGAGRANVARDNGADILISIHMNGIDNAATRGTETFVRANANANVNRGEDVGLAQRVQNAAVGAIPGARDRGVRDDTETHLGSVAMLSDNPNGNTAAFHPIRACLLEVEFISNAAVDALFNTGANQAANRQAVADAVAGAIVADLAAQP